jgi:dimethylargininase
MLAITHLPSPRMNAGERTFVGREPIDHALALRQHAAYCDLLRACGAEVLVLDANRDLPDCAFVEDAAVVLDEVAILCAMGTASRRAEPAAIEPVLGKYREVVRVAAPETLEGGDVLQVGRDLLVGVSSRTNRAGIASLENTALRHGYRVVPVGVYGCLHLKTACTALDDQTLLLHRDWIDVRPLAGFQQVAVPLAEPWGANVLRIGSTICASAAHPRTAELLRQRGHDVRTINLSEFAKAEAGVTCLSLLVNDSR